MHAHQCVVITYHSLYFFSVIAPMMQAKMAVEDKYSVSIPETPRHFGVVKGDLAAMCH
jgi:hypothetical protein